MALSIAKKLYIEAINDSNEVNLSLSNVQGCTLRSGTDAAGSKQ